MSITVFYFSGTGNSLYLAEKIAAGLGDTELIRISDKTKFSNEDFEKFLDVKRIGIVTPVYWVGLPVLVRQFIRNFLARLKVAGYCENKYFFVVLSYGGLAGQVFDELRGIFAKLDLSIDFRAAVEMPENYIPLFKVPSDSSIEKLLDKTDIKTETIIKNIKNKESNFIQGYSGFLIDWFWKLFHNLFIGFIKRFNPGKNFWVDEKCNGCGICIPNCHEGALQIIDNKARLISDLFCDGLGNCVGYCPLDAI